MYLYRFCVLYYDQIPVLMATLLYTTVPPSFPDFILNVESEEETRSHDTGEDTEEILVRP